MLTLDSNYIRKQFSEYELTRAIKATKLAITQDRQIKAKNMKDVIPEEYWDYKEVFETEEFDQLPE